MIFQPWPISYEGLGLDLLDRVNDIRRLRTLGVIDIGKRIDDLAFLVENNGSRSRKHGLPDALVPVHLIEIDPEAAIDLLDVITDGERDAQLACDDKPLIGEDLVRDLVLLLGGESLVGRLRAESDQGGAEGLDLVDGLGEGPQGKVAVRAPAAAVVGQDDGRAAAEQRVERHGLALGVGQRERLDLGAQRRRGRGEAGRESGGRGVDGFDHLGRGLGAERLLEGGEFGGQGACGVGGHGERFGGGGGGGEDAGRGGVAREMWG